MSLPLDVITTTKTHVVDDDDDDDDSNILIKSHRNNKVRNISLTGLLASMMILIGAAIIWGIFAFQGQAEKSVSQSSSTIVINEPNGDDIWTDDKDWSVDGLDMECLSDRLEPFHLLIPGQGICNDNHRFGMTMDRALIWYSNGVTYMLHQDPQADAYQFTDQGYFQFLDVTNQVLWETYPTMEISPCVQQKQQSSSSTSLLLLQDCPHVHLQTNGELVMKSKGQGSLDEWSDHRIPILYPQLFRDPIVFKSESPNLICITDRLIHWQILEAGQAFCNKGQRFGLTSTGALIWSSMLNNNMDKVTTTTILHQDTLAQFFEFTEQGSFQLWSGYYNLLWEASPTVQIAANSYFPMLRLEENGTLVLTSISNNNSTFTSHNVRDVFPDLFTNVSV